MITVPILASSRYPIRRKTIKQTIEKTLQSLQLYGDFVVEVNVVGDRKMRELKLAHLGVDETTDVLSFPLQEKMVGESSWESQKRGRTERAKTTQASSFVEYPDNFVRLGTIVISYPQAQRQANLHKLTIDDEISQLVEHGIMHLAGIHHE